MRWFFGLAGLLLALGWAQFNPGPAEYYAQCRTLYEGQVPSGARTACELALVADPDYVPALKLLVRIHLEEGNLEDAEQGLGHLMELAPNDLEARALEARYLLEAGRPGEALALVDHNPLPEAVRTKARALEATGRFEEALDTYREAVLLGEEEARVDAARLLERMGRPDEALAELDEVESTPLLLLKGRLLWSAGRLPEAAEVLEAALADLPGTDPSYTEALAVLARVYYGTGDTRRGRMALTQLSGRVNLIASVLRSGWLWFLGLVLLVGMHLFGESRIEPVSTLEVHVGGAWGVGRTYGAMLLAWLVGAGASLASGWYLYRNWLAVFTPVQAEVVRPVFFLAAAVVVFLYGWSALRPPDEDAPSPLGRRESWIEGLWVGVLFFILLVGYAWLSGRNPWLEPMPFNPLLPAGALAIAGLALMEPLLRVRLPASLRVRYGAAQAPVQAVLVAGLFLIAPVVLWWAVSVVSLAIFTRLRSLLPVMVGWVVLAVLLLGSSFLPVVRALF